MTSKVVYLSDLRTECEHLQSDNTFITDAPTDNNGKGQAFSPTDTVATALASCMLTVMGIKANDMGLKLDGSFAEVTKIMSSNPRRIAEIQVQLQMNLSVDDKQRLVLERTGLTCPVNESLHPELKRTISFSWK
jgi:uncharacterized OsmC-like protein